MSEITRLLNDISAGNPSNLDSLVPLVYQHLKQLARARMAHENRNAGIGATDLVHEAYLRLVDVSEPNRWKTRNHFYCAAAEAMRRILIERARKRKAIKHGGEFRQVELDEEAIASQETDEKLLQLNDALQRLEELDAERANLVRLRYFAGFTVAEAAAILGVSKTNAERSWAYIRAWLQNEMRFD